MGRAQGNGAVPFPGRRVTAVRPWLFDGHTEYEIREYLGDETVVAYRYVVSDELAVPVDWLWDELEHEFRGYLSATAGGHLSGDEETRTPSNRPSDRAVRF